ncbi:MAG TPA: LptF/LptG family permease [Longimicrobiaceae bacterium]
MKVLTRYLLRAHVGPLIFAFVALTGVILINTLARSLADLAGKGLPVRIFLEFFVLSLPANIALTLPMSVLVAVLYAFSQMAAENEITALRASGVDLRRIVLPLLLVASVIAGVMVWFNNEVLPAANFRWRILMTDIGQTSPLLALQPQIINSVTTGDGSQFYIQATEIDEAGSRLYDVAIYDVSSPNKTRTIYADSGRMLRSADGADFMLTLYDGSIREMQGNDPEAFQRITFKQQILRMPGVRQTLERSEDSGRRTDRDMPASMMRDTIAALRVQLANLEANKNKPIPPSAGVPEQMEVQGRLLPYAEARIQGVKREIRRYQVEIQKKYSIAAATLVFVLVGVPLALRFPRGGLGMVIAASLTIFSVYYVGLIGGEALADQGLMPPWMAMWLTNGIFGTLGLLGVWRMGREQATTRGGGWRLPSWLRVSLRRRSHRRAEGTA